MADATSDIIIEIKGQSQNLKDAVKSAADQLNALGGATTKATGDTSKLGEASKKTEQEERSLAESVRIAAESVGLLGIESGESASKLFLARDAAGEFTKSMGGMKAAIVGGIGLTAAFAGLSFLKESIKDAMAGEQAQAQLNNALGKTPEKLKQTNEEIEQGAGAWARYGVGVAGVKAAIAKGAALGIDPSVILANRKGVEDLAVAMGGSGDTGLMGAIDAVTAGGERAGRSLRLLNLDITKQQELAAKLRYTMDPTKRFQLIMNAVESSGRAGAADAQAATTQGKFDALGKSLENLRESVGSNLIPAVTDMAQALTGLLNGANSLLGAFGGLGNFLQATWRPILIGGISLFVGLKLAHSKLGEYLRSTFMGDVATSTASLADEGVAATKLTDTLNAIPKDVSTIAIFHAEGASTAKDAYLLNLSRIPGALIPGEAVTPQPVTVPVFADEAAKTEVGVYEGELAAIPRTVTTVGSFVPGILAGTAISVGATIAAIAIADGALNPLKDAIGHLIATVTGTNVADGVHANVDATANVNSANVKTGTIVTVDGKVNVGTVTLPAKEKITITADAKVAHIILPKGTTFNVETANVKSITVPKGTTVHVAGDAEINGVRVQPGRTLTVSGVHGTATIDNVVVAKGKTLSIGTVHGTATIDGVTVAKGKTLTISNVHGTAVIENVIPAPGKSLTISNVHGTAYIDNVTVAKGRTLTISNVHGTATIDGATVAPGKKISVTNIHGVAYIDNVIPAPGKRLTISGVNGTAVIDGVTLKKGAKVDVTGGTASIDTLQAKAVKVSNPLLEADSFGSKNKPAPYYIKYVAVNAPPKPPTATTPKSNGGGPDIVGTAGNIALGIGESIITGLIISKFMGGGGGSGGSGIKDLIKNMFKKGPPGGGSGGASSIEDSDPALYEQDIIQKLMDAPSATPKRTVPVDPARSPARPTKPAGGWTLPDLAKPLETTFSTAFKAGGVIAAVGLGLAGIFKAGPVIKTAAAGLAGTVESAFTSVIALITFPIKGLTTSNKSKGKTGGLSTAIILPTGLDMTIYNLGVAMVGKFSDGIKAGWSALTQRVSALFNDLINAIIQPINAVLSHIPGTHPIPLAGAHSSSSHSTGHGGSKGTGFNLASINQSLIHAGSPAAAGASPTTHHAPAHASTQNVSVTIHVDGAKDPKAVALEIQKALTSISSAAQRKRQHGR